MQQSHLVFGSYEFFHWYGRKRKVKKQVFTNCNAQCDSNLGTIWVKLYWADVQQFEWSHVVVQNFLETTRSKNFFIEFDSTTSQTQVGQTEMQNCNTFKCCVESLSCTKKKCSVSLQEVSTQHAPHGVSVVTCWNMMPLTYNSTSSNLTRHHS